MNLAKGIIYVLVCVGITLTAQFFNELGIIGIILTYNFGVGVGFIIWKKDVELPTDFD